MAGVLTGIARHRRRMGPIETIERAEISVTGGIAGDCRGSVKPGGRGRRQVTMMTCADWTAAMRELGADIPWQERRVNLLIDGAPLSRRPGTRVSIGAVELELSFECYPCARMDQVADGLRAALTPEWRGGVCMRVLSGGEIVVGDKVTWDPA